MNIVQKFTAIHEMATRLEASPKDSKLVADLARRIKELSIIEHTTTTRPRAAEFHRLEMFELTNLETGASRIAIGWDYLSKLAGVKESSLRVQFSMNGNEMMERVFREGHSFTSYAVRRMRAHATPEQRRAQDDAAAAPPPAPKIRKTFAPGLKYQN